MMRSPSGRSDSDPNLSETYVSHRKRKHGDEFNKLFEEFSKNIISKLATWKSEVTDEVSKITDNLTNIKEDLLKLKEATNELKTEFTSIKNDYTSIKKITQDIISDHIKINEEFDSIKTSIQFISDNDDEVNTKLKLVTEDVKKIVSLESKLSEVQAQNRMLTLQINMNDQRDRLMNLEIVGVPENPEEKPINIVLKIAELSNIKVDPTQIVYANRITPKTKIEGRPRIIIAKLTSRVLKDNIISGARKQRLTTKDLCTTSEIRPIFVNDNLTSYNKQLLKKSKELAKNKEYQYVWSKNGKIYIRKSDTSPMIHISDEKDLSSKII